MRVLCGGVYLLIYVCCSVVNLIDEEMREAQRVSAEQASLRAMDLPRFQAFKRKRLSAAPALVFLVALVILLVRPADGAVMSIDLGSEWMKVAVVNLKPGQAPISVALNEMSKRKSPALVAFSNGDRLLAEEAAGINVRYPERVYARVRDMIGKPAKDVKRMLDDNFLPYDVVVDDRGTVNIRTHGKGAIYSSEELLAMVLSYGRELAEAHAKSAIKDAVLTIPPYLGQAERRGILDAAQIAGITVLALAHEHSGAALQYGIDKDFTNASRDVIFYDMGANSLYAAVVSFSAYSGKDRGKTMTFNQFQVKGVRWDASLGGQTMEARLLDHFAQEFNSQVGGKFDVRKFPKAMAKLKKQVKRTKEILSANTEAPLSVEAVHDDRDFRSSITRQKFEELCSDLWDRALVPLKKVIEDTSVNVADVHSVELIGGATRVPRLQAALSEFLGKESLDRHLDADEAISLGASLHAANLSDRVKLNRKFGMIDGASYGIIWKVQGASPKVLDDMDKEQILVPRMKKVPSKVFRTFKNQKDDFKISLEYHPSLIPPGVSSPEFAAFQVTGVAEVAKKYASYNLSAPIKTNVHFSLSHSGIINFDKAESVLEVSEWYGVPIKINSTANNSSPESNSKTLEEPVSTEQSNKEEDDIASTKENEASDSGVTPTIDEHLGKEEAAGEPDAKSEPLVKRKLRKRTVRVPLKIKDLKKGPNQPLSVKAIQDSVARLEKLQLKDEVKKKTAEAKNSLESHIYATKEKLESAENIETISTEDQRDALRSELNEAEDWLYMDGENASADEFEKKLDALQMSEEEIFTRLSELEARPVAVKAARSYLKSLDETLIEWENSKPWIPHEKKYKLREEMKSVGQWLDDMEAKQEKLKGYETPAFTSTDAYAEMGSLNKAVAVLNKMQKPKPPKVEENAETIKIEEPTSTAGDESPEEVPSGKTVEDEEVAFPDNDKAGSTAGPDSQTHDEL